MYYESTLSVSALARMGLFVFNRCMQEGYGFRRTMVLIFIGINSFGRLYEMFNRSAYHEEQGQAVGAVVFVGIIYALARTINEFKPAIALRKVLYWITVGNLKTDVRKGK